MADLKVLFQENRCKIISQVFCCDLHDTWENRKVLFVMLRSLCSPTTGKPFFSYQCLADAFGYKARQNIHNYVREYEQCDENFFEYLRHKRKIEPLVVEAVYVELSQDILAKTETVRVQVNQRLGREDITSENIRTAFTQIPCTVIRQQAMREFAEGRFHPKEPVVLAELFAALEHHEAKELRQARKGVSSPTKEGHGTHTRVAGSLETTKKEEAESAEGERPNERLSQVMDTESEKLLRYAELASTVGIEAIREAPDEAIIQKRHVTWVRALLTPQLPLSEIPESVAQMARAMAMYSSGASFSQLGRWFGGKAKRGVIHEYR